MTLLIGLGVVVLSAIVVVPMLFTVGREPAMVPTRPQRINRGDAQVGPRRGAPARIRPSWAERTRGVVGLLFVTAGIGAALALVLGLIVLAGGLALFR